MKSKWIIIVVLVTLIFSLSGCTKEEVNIERNGAEQVEAISLIYKGNTVLTEDSMAEVLKTFLSIANETELKKLEELPLTEEFFNKCVEDFLYVEGAGEYKEINIEFWSMDGEGKCICLVDFCKEKNPSGNPVLCEPDHVYTVEMMIVNDRIDTMKLEMLR